MAVDRRPDDKPRQLRVRADSAEREFFERAARFSGLTLSAWLRQACRAAAARQLQDAGIKVPWA